MKTTVENRLIWYNGEIVNVNDAKINVLAPTSQFGLNVFEGIPCYFNEEQNQLYAFRLDDHYNRLLRSAKMLEINCPFSKDEMKKAFIDVIKANDYTENLSVRQTLFVDGFGSWGSSEPVGMFVAPIPKRNTSKEYNKTGLNVCVSSWRRISEATLSSSVMPRTPPFLARSMAFERSLETVIGRFPKRSNISIISLVKASSLSRAMVLSNILKERALCLPPSVLVYEASFSVTFSNSNFS